MQVCCGSGLQRIYEFLQTDEHCARPDLDLTMIKVSPPSPATCMAASTAACLLTCLERAGLAVKHDCKQPAWLPTTIPLHEC